MFCTKCGKEFREGAAFCTGCGAPRPKLEGPAPQPAAVEAAAPAPVPAPTLEAPETEVPAAEPSAPTGPVEESPFVSDPEPEAQPEPIVLEPPVQQAPAPVIQPTVPAVQEAPPPAPPAVPPAAPPPQPPIDLEPSAPKKKKGAGGIIALIVVLVLLAAAAACFFLGKAGVEPFALLFSLGEGGGDSGTDDPYQDTVDLSSLIAGPDNFDSQRIGVNAVVSKLDGALLTAQVSDGKDELEATLSFSPDDIDAFTRGDTIYIDGTFHAGSEYTFEPAIVTLTGGRGEGTSMRTTASEKPGSEEDDSASAEGAAAEPWTVSDYTPYQGYFTAAATEQEFASHGGPVVVLSSERSSLLYEVYNYDIGGTRAMISGAAPMDGSTEISFYGDDASGNTVSGTLYLLEDGSVAVESQVVDAGTSGWALKMDYTPLAPCAFPDYFTEVQPPEHQQELRVATNGPYATVTLYNWSNGDWVEAMSFQATIGSNGISDAKQEGDRCTPAGTYDILFAFSTLDIFSGIPYQRIAEGDVWVTDPNSIFYNTLQTVYNPDADWSEAEDLYSKFANGRSTACIYFAFNGDGTSAYSATANGGSDLFLDGIGANGNLTTGYGDIKTDGQNVLDLLYELNGNKNPVIVIY